MHALVSKEELTLRTSMEGKLAIKRTLVLRGVD